MLHNLLRGFLPQTPQTLGNMTLVPLVKQETEHVNVGDLRDLYLAQDIDYGTLMMGTRSPHITIIPQGLVYITKERAQDRALPSAHLVQTQKACPAFCVQSSQGGLMQQDKVEQREFRLLPAKVRFAALAKRHQQQFSAIWDDLKTFNQQLNVSGNFLVSFFQHYQKQLAEFVAEFEPVEYQRGAVILINGEVVGIEVMPNNTAFLTLWEPLIRDCYGAQALLQSADTPLPPPVLLADVDNLDNLVAAVNHLALQERVWVESVIAPILAQKEKLHKEETMGEFHLHGVTTPEFQGQLVEYNGDTLYLSLLQKPRQC